MNGSPQLPTNWVVISHPPYAWPGCTPWQGWQMTGLRTGRPALMSCARTSAYPTNQTQATTLPRRNGLPFGPAVRSATPLLATSLFGDLAAGLYEDASARLREHPALLRLLSLASGPRAVGHLDLPAGDKELPETAN